MDSWDFKKWRKNLRLTQAEAGKMLSLSRGAVQRWESEEISIPYAIELACNELTRRWKQRPEFGPVILVYTDTPLWQRPEEPPRVLLLQCESHATNDSAIEQACRLSTVSDFANPFIMEESLDVVWTPPELARECERRTRAGGSATRQIVDDGSPR